MIFYSTNIFMDIGIIISFILFSFLMFLAIIFIVSRLKKKPSEDINYGFAPPVSIIIPCHNESSNIESCLASVLSQDYVGETEIIVADDGSIDGTVSKIESYMKKHGSKLKILKLKHSGKSETLNSAIKTAKFDIIMTVDADIKLSRHTLSRLVAPLADEDVAATNSVAIIGKPKGLLEHFQAIEFSMNSIIRTSFSKVFTSSIWFFGAVACYKKKILKEVGYMKKDSLTEDMDICLELYNKDYRIVTVENSVVTTKACPNVQSLTKQRMRWYYGALQALTKNRSVLKKDSAPVRFLYFNQYWWTIFAFIFFPMTAYQVYFWFPQGFGEVISYIFRWFTLAGPFYVLYKLNGWGLNFMNIFGVMSGIITFLLSLAALKLYRDKLNIFWTIIALFIYFPYTILLNFTLICGVIKYRFSKKKYFMN